MKDVLRQDVERTAGETIQRVSEVSTNLMTPAYEGIREIRLELSRQAQQTESLAKETRDSVDRVSREVDQIPERMKVTGKKISNVQQALESIRDQIEQLRHQFEAGLHNTERRQLEQQSRDESRNSELIRVAAMRDEMILNLRAEFARLCSELNEISPTLSAPLSRIEEKLQSIVRELDRERPPESDHSDWMSRVKVLLDEVASLAESMRPESPTDAESPEPDIEEEIPVEAESDSPPESETSPKTDEAESQTEDDSAESSRQKAETKKRNQWIRELRMLPGLGEKSAGTLVDFGVNTIQELSNLGAGQKAVIRELGGRLRDIDEWVKAARKVRLLNDHLELARKEAIAFVVSKTWPESFLRLSDSELSELSTEFPEILDWVRESRPNPEA
jgi:predicted flap endonuclease-1-like 5' DNA nuclease